jgi:hypothetical protein
MDDQIDEQGEYQPDWNPPPAAGAPWTCCSEGTRASLGWSSSLSPPFIGGKSATPARRACRWRCGTRPRRLGRLAGDLNVDAGGRAEHRGTSGGQFLFHTSCGGDRPGHGGPLGLRGYLTKLLRGDVHAQRASSTRRGNESPPRGVADAARVGRARRV